MDVIESTLASIDGGRVLDVATQEGRFARVLMDNLASYTEIIGIDVNERAIEAAKGAVAADGVCFRVMDAEELEFEDETFDSVSISASLHHMADVHRTLDEMKRVLRPSGRFIIVEMHRDIQTEPERTSALLHQWAAEIDSALGRLHNRTMTRAEILEHVSRLELKNVQLHDCFDRDSDPMEAAGLEMLEDVIARITERAMGTGSSGEFRRRGEQLMQRVREVGAQREPMLLVIGKK